MSYARVIGTGSYLPEKVLTNAELALSVDTSDQWIVERTGIRQRHIAAANEFVSDLALHASKKALRAAHIDADRIDLIVLATSTPDMIFPSSACLLQAKLGIKGGAAFDVQAVCSGFVYAMATAEALMRGGQYRYALVVGAEVFSRILNWQDRTTCVLFGDGAGACVLARSESAGILSTHLHADGSHAQMLQVPGSVCGGKVQGSPFLTMDGQGVFKFAVRVLDEVAQEALRANDMSVAQLDWVIPHQANVRIIDATAKKMGLPHERMLITVDRHANTSAASIPLAFDQGVREGRIKPGQHIMMLGVGGGFTWGSVLLRY